MVCVSRRLGQVSPFPVEILQSHEWVTDVVYHCSTLHASPLFIPKNPIKDRTMLRISRRTKRFQILISERSHLRYVRRDGRGENRL
ncbi:Uncharacterised protein [Enterobacter cloacae]|nr:Uncharacterised protein [Enterobacter cloacae]